MHAQCEILRRHVIHGDDHYAAQGASEKRRNPLGRVRTPDENPLGLRNSASIQLARKLKSEFSDLSVRPAHSAISAMLHVGNLVPSLQKMVEVCENRGLHISML